MKAEGIVTQKDYLSSQYLHIRPRLIFLIVGLILLVLAVVVLFLSFTWFLFGAIMYLALYFFAYIPWRAIQAYKEYSAIKVKISLDIVEKGIELKSSRGQGIMLWGDIVKIKYNNNLLLICPTQSIFYLVPAHFFDTSQKYMDFIRSIELNTKKT